jgi:hypothetical protein
MANRTRPSLHLTLDAELHKRVGEDAARLRASYSQVIESHLTSYYAGGHIEARLDRVERNLNVLMAEVLPLVARVNTLLRQVEEQTGGVSQTSATPPLKVVSYKEMYDDPSRVP